MTLPPRAGAPRPWLHLLLAACALGLLLPLAGCTVLANNRHVNAPMTAEFAEQVQRGRVSVGGESMIGVSLSGGGLRAAAFGLGVLQALAAAEHAEGDLFDDLGFISSVSGGSLTAAYTGVYGREVLTQFRDAVLYRDLERDMRRSLLSPANLMRLLGGGLNDVTNMAQTLDREVFQGATFADLYRRRKPEIWINASDLYNRTPFPFIPDVFAALCSDLTQLPVSEAVAASMAVPLVFAPIVLRPHANDCATPIPQWMLDPVSLRNASALSRAFAAAVRNYRDPQRMRYVKLVDGGVTDNNGLASLVLANSMTPSPYGPFTEEEAVRVKRLLFLIVDAGRPVTGEWAKVAEGPSAMELSIAATDTATDSATRVSLDAFTAIMRPTRDRIIEQRCKLSPEQFARIAGTPTPGRCDELELLIGVVGFDDLDGPLAERMRQMPTRLTLPKEDIDAAVLAGRLAVEHNAAFARYRQLKSQGKTVNPR